MSPTPRISSLEGPFESELESDLKKILPLGMKAPKLYTTIACHDTIFHRLVSSELLGPRGLMGDGVLSPQLRELSILRTCAMCQSEYEWGIHVAIFQEIFGFSDRQIKNTTELDVNSQLWSEHELEIMLAVDELLTNKGLSDECWDKVSSFLDKKQIIELVTIVGLYTTVSMLANTSRVENEAYAPNFPHSDIGLV